MLMNRKDLVGGPGGVRTLDLMTASHARSQLRHRPTAADFTVIHFYHATSPLSNERGTGMSCLMGNPLRILTGVGAARRQKRAFAPPCRGSAGALV